MGKPEDNRPHSPSPSATTPLAESASAISLHTTSSGTANPPIQRFFDDDPTELDGNDLPPLYSDHDLDTVAPSDPLIPRGTPELSIHPFVSRTDTDYYIDKRLDSDPDFLKSQLDILAANPPRPFAQIRGTHNETHRNGDKSETKQVVDFDVEIELTHLLFTDTRTQSSWRQLTTVSNFEKVRRGTILTKRAPGFGGSGSVAEEGDPGVVEWCHRFCASGAGLKAFRLERRVQGWDFDLVRRKIERLIRDTNYRGHIDIQFPVHNACVEIYNDCRTSRWRLTKWIEMLCVFTLMFIFTWPWLFFRTKRWETVYVSWPLSKDGVYASLSEEHWYNMWAKAIQRAILSRRKGQLDQGDLQSAELPPEERQTGFLGAVQTGIEAMGVVNRSMGWGGDSEGSSSRWGGIRLSGGTQSC